MTQGAGGVGPAASARRAIVDRMRAAFSACDVDTWGGVLHEEVEITLDSGISCGRAAARSYAAHDIRASASVVSDALCVVAESHDIVVSEVRLVKSAAAARPDAAEPAAPFRLDGLICQIVRLRDKRVITLRSYCAEGALVARRRSRLERLAGEIAAGGHCASLVEADVTDQSQAKPCGRAVGGESRQARHCGQQRWPHAGWPGGRGADREVGPHGRGQCVGAAVHRARSGARLARRGARLAGSSCAVLPYLLVRDSLTEQLAELEGQQGRKSPPTSPPPSIARLSH